MTESREAVRLGRSVPNRACHACAIGGILQESPFFVPPDEFLRELMGRAVEG